MPKMRKKADMPVGEQVAARCGGGRAAGLPGKGPVCTGAAVIIAIHRIPSGDRKSRIQRVGKLRSNFRRSRGDFYVAAEGAGR